MVLWAVAGRKAVVGWRHIRVAYQPARKVRRSPGLLVTPTSSRSMQGIVVAVVVVHNRVVRKTRDKTHGGIHNTRSRDHTHSRTLKRAPTDRVWMLRLYALVRRLAVVQS